MSYLIAILMSFLLIGCQNQTSQPLQQAAQVIEKPVIVKPPDMLLKYQFAYDSNSALKKAYEQFLHTGKAPNIITEGFEQFAYGTSQPIIAASTFELTVISLEVGEQVTNVSSGDPTRWSYSLAYSGQDDLKQAHVMVKPSQEDISTDLVITTDKRLYTLKLVSTKDGKYVKDVRFWYPEEMQKYWNNYNAKRTQNFVEGQKTKVAELPGINVNNLNFAYGLSHSGWSTPSWIPIRIFDDGVHTYIQFPASISSKDMPALFIQNGKQQELVNYRAKAPYFVVDKIFQKAVLLSGVGSNQVKVEIVNNNFR